MIRPEDELFDAGPSEDDLDNPAFSVDVGSYFAELDAQAAEEFELDAGRDLAPPVAPIENGTKPRLMLRKLSSYTIRSVAWLEKPFWQAAAFILLAGRKGSCKGTYLARHSARVTTGELYRKPKRVLVITSEDSIELDFLPRFRAAGGDEEMLEIVVGPFRLPEDIAWIKAQALALGDVGLIIIDPIGNHIGGRDSHKEELVRVAIQGLNPLADELNCMVVGVRHLGKDTSRGALASVLGSTAFVDVPRCVILMAADPEDDFLFHAQVVAGNRGPRTSTGRAFQLELVDVPPAREITHLVPAGESTKDVGELLGATTRTESSKSGRARELILNILEREGKQESDALDARVAKETGLAVKTVQNARSALTTEEGLVKSYPEKDEFNTILRWIVSRTQAPR